MQVNSSPSVTNEFIWAQGNAAGTVRHRLVPEPTRSGQPDSFPNWADDPQGATSVKWWGYVGVISKATTAYATIAQQRFTEKPMHYGQICNQGIGCTVSGGDRQMADYFGFNLDKAETRFGSSTTTRRTSTTARACSRSRQVGGKTDPRRRPPKGPDGEGSGHGSDRRRPVAALLSDRGRGRTSRSSTSRACRSASRAPARCGYACRSRACSRCSRRPVRRARSG